MTIEDQFSEALQQVLQDNPGISQSEAERIASQAVTPAGEPDRYVNEQLASVGGFIGDPAVPGSNRFSTAVQPNGTSSWTSGPVSPAGTAFNVAGDRWSTAAVKRGEAGASTEDVNAVINVPAQRLDEALVRLAGGWDVPKGVMANLTKEKDQALEDSIVLINSGMPTGEAQTAKLQPVFNKIAGVAAEYKHKQAGNQVHYTTDPNAGLIGVNAAGEGRLVYPFAPKPESKSVYVQFGTPGTAEAYTQRFTDKENRARLAAIPASEDVQTLLNEYKDHKENVKAGDMHYGLANTLNRNSRLEALKMDLARKGWDADTGKRLSSSGESSPIAPAGGASASDQFDSVDNARKAGKNTGDKIMLWDPNQKRFRPFQLE